MLLTFVELSGRASVVADVTDEHQAYVRSLDEWSTWELRWTWYEFGGRRFNIL
jgi:hypothetical protein